MSNPDLLLHERQTLIARRLRDDGRVIAAVMAQELSISEDTIRRDLREMAAAGLCRRVYGGALPAEEVGPTLTQRLQVGSERKTAMARAAVTLFEPGMSLFIDAGSTNLAIANAIPPGLELTVITNAPSIASALLDRREIDIVLLGGKIDHRAGAVYGSRAMADAAHFHPDFCIMGSCGFEISTGISAQDFEEAEFKRFIAPRSKSVLAAITNEKLGVPAPFAVLPIGRRDHVVLEHDAATVHVTSLRRIGTHVIIADATPS
jgi:DeoR/GlpR family transcriptional regulator of sugar metabolism